MIEKNILDFIEELMDQGYSEDEAYLMADDIYDLYDR